MNKIGIKIFLILFSVLIGLSVIAQDKDQDLMNINSISPQDYKVLIVDNEELDNLQYSITDYSSLIVAKDNLPKENDAAIFWMIINNEKNVADKILEIYAPNMMDVKVIGVSYKNLLNPEFNTLPIKKYLNISYHFFVDEKYDLLLISNSTKAFKGYELKLYEERSFVKKRIAYNILYGISIGILVVLFLYHLILYVKVKDSLYILYISYILIVGLTMNQYVASFFKDCAICDFLLYLTIFNLGLLFSYKFLSIKSNYKRYFIYTGVLVFFVLLLSLIFTRNISRYVIFTSGIFVSAFVTFFSFIRVQQSYQSAKWFSIPWAILLFVFVTLLFVDKRSPLYEFGYIIHLGLMSMALANKLYEYKIAKSYAESKEIEALSERDRVIFEQNQALKELIDIRNQEIIRRNDELEKQQNEIKDKTKIIQKTNERLNKINEELYLKNHEISTHNSELQKHKELLEIIIRKRRKKLIAARERANLATKLKANFLSNLTNEIRIPMNAITGFASMLNNQELSIQNRNDFLDKISNNVDVLLETIDNIVLLARIQSGIFKPKIKPFALNELLIGCLKYYKNKAEGENKDLNILLEDSKLPLGTIIKSDHNKLKLIVGYLIENAIKFSENGNITISGNIYKENILKDYNSTLVLSVSDNGIGIEKEKLEFIFERFAKIESDKTKLYYGTGIGLAIVKGVVDILHGKILVESKPGVGTKFSVSVPVNV